MKKIIAQGTIEYLVVIGIIVIIGLVTVSMSTNFLDSGSQISNTTGSIQSTIGQGGISVVEAVTDSNGNVVFTITNNTPEKLTLTSVTPIDASGDKGTTKTYTPPTHFAENKTYIYPSDLKCTCNENETKKTCYYEIEITSAQGLINKETIQLNVNCVTNSELTPTTTLVNPIITNCYDTTQNPIPICTLSDLNRIRENLTANYILMNDIDATPTATWNEGLGFEPIGNSLLAFTGELNGNNLQITNLFINRSNENYVGFFANSSGNISNISLIDINFNGYDTVGGISGAFGSIDDSTCLLNNVKVTGTLYGFSYIGGLVGYNFCDINNSSAETNNYLNIPQNYVLGEDIIYSVIGGIVGENYNNINKSYFSGNIYFNGLGTTYLGHAGGLVGTQYGGRIIDSYSIGNISGTSNQYESHFGGLVGSTGEYSTINNSYSAENISITGSNTSIGGLIGSNFSGQITSSYYDSTISNLFDTGKGIPKTTSEMYEQSTYSNWDFVNTWNSPNNSYPILSWQ